jgi:hypothetical protein
MVKFVIAFHTLGNGQSITEFEAGYARFLGMVEQIPDIRRRQVIQVLGSPQGEARFYKILELYFDTPAAMDAALNSEAGQIAGAGLFEVFRPLGYGFDTFFADVYEEAGGATPTASQDNRGQNAQ